MVKGKKEIREKKITKCKGAALSLKHTTKGGLRNGNERKKRGGLLSNGERGRFSTNDPTT